MGQSSCARAKWKPASVTRPQLNRDDELTCAEEAYAMGLELERCNDAFCVDYFFKAALCAWPCVESRLCELCELHGRAGEVYHSSLIKLIVAGQTFRRLDPRQGLTVHTPSGVQTIPITYHGFVWQPEDFDHVTPVGDYATKELTRFYSNEGLGVATVVTRCRRPGEPFVRRRQVFAATILLRPVASPTRGYVFEFFDPLRVSSVAMRRCVAHLERDLTAPIAYVLSQADRNYLSNFLQPGSTTEETGLFMIEPYQAGKMPVVIVHGLLSEPFTWVDLVNEMRARPDINARYQFWGFQYATGEPFLQSAAVLRRQLYQALAQLDPLGNDPALSRTVLVGHSMGGLISKLQISHSGNELWRSACCRPFQQIVTTPSTRQHLGTAFFFDPVPTVSRVIYIGTPHKGSVWARRPIGRFGAALVQASSSMEAEHAQLVRDNPNSFSAEFTERVPTSIDLLDPDSPLLRAMDRLPISPAVQEHSILGNGYCMLGVGDSDKVVPVFSASRPGVVSEKRIHANHQDVHQSDEGIREVVRILRLHAVAN